mgnify:CR=1 FL=1
MTAVDRLGLTGPAAFGAPMRDNADCERRPSRFYRFLRPSFRSQGESPTLAGSRLWPRAPASVAVSAPEGLSVSVVKVLRRRGAG